MCVCVRMHNKYSRIIINDVDVNEYYLNRLPLSYAEHTPCHKGIPCVCTHEKPPTPVGAKGSACLSERTKKISFFFSCA